MKEQHLAFLLHQHQQQSLHTKHYPKYNFVAAAGAAALSASLVKCVLVSQSVIDYHTHRHSQTDTEPDTEKEEEEEARVQNGIAVQTHTHTLHALVIYRQRYWEK